MAQNIFIGVNEHINEKNNAADENNPEKVP
jgi:hypothetical protein